MGSIHKPTTRKALEMFQSYIRWKALPKGVKKEIAKLYKSKYKGAR